MSVPPVSSNVHGQLDAQIAQLIQCKPLPEHEVRYASVILNPSISLAWLAFVGFVRFTFLWLRQSWIDFEWHFDS